MKRITLLISAIAIVTSCNIFLKGSIDIGEQDCLSPKLPILSIMDLPTITAVFLFLILLNICKSRHRRNYF
jgi:hypothetical protein